MSAHENQSPQVPGVPDTSEPTVEEPTAAHPPLPPKPDQGSPERVTPHGCHHGRPGHEHGPAG